MNPDRRQLIEGLRALAAFYEGHPGAYYDGTPVSLCMYLGGAKAQSVMAAMAAISTEYEEICDEQYAAVAAHFGQKVKVELFAPRSQVCQGRVVGTRIEPALVIAPVGEIRIPERVVNVVEWSCSPLFSVDRKTTRE